MNVYDPDQGAHLGGLLDAIDNAETDLAEMDALREALDCALDMLLSIGVEIPRGEG